MFQTLASVGVVLLLVLLLLSVPLGFPGVWIMLVLLLVPAGLGWIPWWLWFVFLVATGLAELAEYVALKRMGDRYGGSSKAFWGAVVGGFAGVIIGLPVPVLGSVLAGFVGTFVGAALVTTVETRSMARASHVGWGVVLGRAFSIVLKVGVGVVILALTSWTLLAG